jgi:hypothetical protein
MKQPIHQRILNPNINIHSHTPQRTPQPRPPIPKRLIRLFRHTIIDIIPVPKFLSQLLALRSLGLVPPLRNAGRLLRLVKKTLQVLERVASKVPLLTRPGIRHKTSVLALSLVPEPRCFHEELVGCGLVGVEEELLGLAAWD